MTDSTESDVPGLKRLEPSPNRRGVREHVVIVGGGFGGLAAARALKNAEVDVTLVDKNLYNTFQPLLYQVATATLNPGDISYFLRSARGKQKNLRVVRGEITGVDADAHRVQLADGRRMRYDRLVLAVGVTANFFGTPGADELAYPLYTRSQAIRLRDTLFARLEAAAQHPDPGDVRVVVVGGGATGVETAGALAELRNKDFPIAYPDIDKSRMHVTLVDMAPNLLMPFSEHSQRYTAEALRERGVDLRLGSGVKEVRSDGVELADGTFLPAMVVIWAGGVTAYKQVGDWGLPQGKGGRFETDEYLKVVGVEDIYAVGDAAVSPAGLPQLAQPAIQGGEYVGAVIAEETGAARDHRPARRALPFQYDDQGILATIGRSSAVAEVRGLPNLTGFPAWTIWTGVHLISLLGQRNRVATMVNLGSRYLTWRGGHNIIVGDAPPEARFPRTHVSGGKPEVKAAPGK
ncbi:NAD(P)/FAD-dependent oxidoreductase [Georgenia sp. Z1344]|uniref:NAD(P)/FAD-dependent oxidoreductase n=1 Tax=Georgenia sp. Z1344 TaxID=3416706 RepID=UPI003CEF2C14